MSMRLFVQTLNFAEGAIGLGVDELRWPNAVRPGDVLTVETEILELRPSRSRPGHGIHSLAQRDDQSARRSRANDAGERDGAEARDTRRPLTTRRRLKCRCEDYALRMRPSMRSQSVVRWICVGHRRLQSRLLRSLG